MMCQLEFAQLIAVFDLCREDPVDVGANHSCNLTILKALLLLRVLLLHRVIASGVYETIA